MNYADSKSNNGTLGTEVDKNLDGTYTEENAALLQLDGEYHTTSCEEQLEIKKDNRQWYDLSMKVRQKLKHFSSKGISLAKIDGYIMELF